MKKFIAIIFAALFVFANSTLEAYTLTLSQDSQMHGCVFGSKILENVDISYPMMRYPMGITTWQGGQGEFALIGNSCSTDLSAGETFFISAAAKPGYRFEGWYYEGIKVSSKTWPILTVSQGGVVTIPTTTLPSYWKENDWSMSLAMPDRDIALTARFVPEQTVKLTLHLCSTINKSVMVGASFADKHGYVWKSPVITEYLYAINVNVDSTITSMNVPPGEEVNLFTVTGACSRFLGYFTDATFTKAFDLENNVFVMPNWDIDIYVELEDFPLYADSQVVEGDAAGFEAVVEWFNQYGLELPAEELLEFVERVSDHCQQHPENLWCLSEIIGHAEGVPLAVKHSIVDRSITACVDYIRNANTEVKKSKAREAIYGLADLIRCVDSVVMREIWLNSIFYAAIDCQNQTSGDPIIIEALPELVEACSPIRDSAKLELVNAMINNLPDCEDSVYIMEDLVFRIRPFTDEVNRLIFEWAVRMCIRNPRAARDIVSLVSELGIALSQEERKSLLNSIFAISEGTKNSNYSDDFDGIQPISVVSTNVFIHYVSNSIVPGFAKPISEDVGFVNVITEVKGNNVAVPETWADTYSKFKDTFGDNFAAALTKKSGKIAAGGREMLVWEDYVAGTDPTDPNDKFTASVTIVDGKPVVSYTPEFADARKELRKYTTYGKVKLTDAEWTVVPEGEEASYNFFKVTVEMK